MKEFLMLYWVTILVWVIIIAALLVAWYFRKIPLVKQALYSLVCSAEKQWGSGTGELKYAAVISMFYSKMPFPIRMMFPQEVISKWIEQAVVKLKFELSDGMDLFGYVEKAEKKE